MSIALIWDRFFWSLVLAILSGFIWLKFVDPVYPKIWVGVAVSLGVGAVFFTIGLAKMLKSVRYERKLEEEAYAELLASGTVQVPHD